MKEKINNRVIAIFSFFGIFLIGFILLLYYIQIANSSEYSVDSPVSTYKVSVNAPRGEIVDSSGNALVYNELINTLTFNYVEFPRNDEDINRIIHSLIYFLSDKNEKWTDTLPLVFDENGDIQYKEKSESAVAYLKSSAVCAVNDYATADNCLQVLIEKYKLSDYSISDARNIASVRYNMDKLYFSSSAPYTFAEGVSVNTIAYVKENVDLYPGVDAGASSQRKYSGDGTAASHLLGVVGAISAEEYSQAKTELEEKLQDTSLTEEEAEILERTRYQLNDHIGKNGIESYAEK